ncbi:hypothetical protein BC937DRAFT_88986 [Endogone sp. FLAS-F59071]|nr:hypothetical protein BC937DRAFT_88986 [Endogone sp. FLAS-F59071]|eukprot:RUS18252.1 hypothetical protein BC937DRAFT_88986 [Endogone sp. FLAS-F59071]
MSLIDLITDSLATIDIKDESVTEYLAGIVQEEWLEESEKREAITEYLKETTDAPTDDLVNDMFSAWREEKAAIKRKEEEEMGKARAVVSSEKDNSATPTAATSKRTTVWDTIEQEDSLSISQRYQRKEMTREERAKREQLLAQYGYQLDDVVEGADGEAEIVYKDNATSGGTTKGDDLLAANRNADVVKEKEQARREQMRKKTEEERERNKALLEKQRLAADKEKKRTQKKEKRRL